MSELTQVRYHVAGGVAVITLDRPDRMNAFTPVMAGEIVTCLDAADADDKVRVVVLTGAGKAFCAGIDLDEAGAPARRNLGSVDGVARDIGGVVSLRIAGLRTFTIAAVNGPAVGVGASMILPTDIRIAAESARFGFVFARRGLVPEAASSWFLPRVVGISQAAEWVATGRVFGADEALAGRLVSRVVSDADLMPTIYGIAADVVTHTSAVSVGLSRQLLWSMLSVESPWEAHRRDSRLIAQLRGGPDAIEGRASFLEKRPARFTGRFADHADLLPPWPGRPDDVEEPR